jgi:Protein of unknown function (DUF4199)
MEEKRAPSIVSIATKYGLIEGVLLFLAFLVRTVADIKQNWVGWVVDTTIMIVLLVLAHLEFKRTHDRTMRYSQGLGSGTLLASMAAVVTCILVFIYVRYFNTGYVAAVLQVQRAALAQHGITGAQAQQAMSITAGIITPAGVAITSLISGVIVGFIVALIVSIFTQEDPRAV